MLYTVKEVAELANVTIKTLHHYHKIALLIPREINEAGYRLYGMQELERLQQILFYRELDFSLQEIKQLLEDEPGRLAILAKQKDLLLARKQRLEQLIQTMDESIDSTAKGERMDKKKMFKGFQHEDEWRDALAEQNQYLQKTYGHDLLANKTIDVDQMNEQAAEAVRFMGGMKNALQTGLKYDHHDVQLLIRAHIDCLTQSGHIKNARDFATQARFFLQDDFHRDMLESQQTGLAYYLCIAAESFATA
ncbi:MerR family transcriptional regulator [Alicyclobacillus fodiniaquatilis]|uniref:MerR family transcriptional regulator n=1 Tax=Alicyclobacillus fodiniaquatilis TaxID=1661150 RepID=A0ABW4JNL0_9BACL